MKLRFPENQRFYAGREPKCEVCGAPADFFDDEADEVVCDACDAEREDDHAA